MEMAGARKSRLEAKIAGGSQMFKFAGESDIMKIGERNAEAVAATLASCGIPVRASDTGGNHGRTIILDTASGDLLVRTIGHGEHTI
jgi:chemotaxis protein CheD